MKCTRAVLQKCNYFSLGLLGDTFFPKKKSSAVHPQFQRLRALGTLQQFFSSVHSLSFTSGFSPREVLIIILRFFYRIHTWRPFDESLWASPKTLPLGWSLQLGQTENWALEKFKEYKEYIPLLCDWAKRFVAPFPHPDFGTMDFKTSDNPHDS